MNESATNHAAATSQGVEKGTIQQTPRATLSDRVRSLRLPERSAAPAPTSTSWLPWALCAFFAAISCFFGYRLSVSETPAADRDKAGSSASLQTGSSDTASSGNMTLLAGGYVIPVHKVQVSPKVGGEVVELFIEEGKYVEKGEIIAKLDPSKYEFEYRRMQALADQAEADFQKMKNGYRKEEKEQTAAALREAEALRNQLHDEADRMRRSRSASSNEELVRIESRLIQAQHKCEQLRQNHNLMSEGYREEEVDRAEATRNHAIAQRDNAKYDLDNTTVVAPISGSILVKKAEIGNTVRPEAYSNGLSACLCEMADLKDLEVDVDVSERDLERLYLGQPCEVRTEAFPNRVYKGEISRMMPEANRSKACVSVRVRIEVPDNDNLLRPEMRARVGFLAKK